MKTGNAVILILVLLSGIIMAQNLTVKQTSEKIFELCSKSDYKNAAGLFIYTGNGSDNLKRAVNFKNKAEFTQVKRICKKIKGLLQISSSYKVSEPVKNGESYNCKAEFKSGKQNLHFHLVFVKLKNKFLLKSFK